MSLYFGAESRRLAVGFLVYRHSGNLNDIPDILFRRREEERVWYSKHGYSVSFTNERDMHTASGTSNI